MGQDAFRWQLDGDLAALAELRLQLRDYLAERAVPATVANDVLLSLQEASKNAVRASGGRPVDVAVSIERDSVSVCVSDHGRGFAPSPAELPERLADARAGSLSDALADGQRRDRLLRWRHGLDASAALRIARLVGLPPRRPPRFGSLTAPS